MLLLKCLASGGGEVQTLKLCVRLRRIKSRLIRRGGCSENGLLSNRLTVLCFQNKKSTKKNHYVNNKRIRINWNEKGK
jgi:hypothetical protein